MIHLAAHHFVMGLGHGASEECSEGVDESLEVEADIIQDISEEFSPWDTIGKVIAMVHQIRASPQARAFLSKMLLEEGLDDIELLNWICTRWASLYHCIDRVIYMKPVSAPSHP